jgi:hypothetical protein
MDMDWHSIWPVVSLGAAQLLALAGAYYGLKADNAKLASDLSLAMLAEKGARESSVTTVRHDLTSMLTKIEGYVMDLTHRVTTLESGQDEWTKALRQRTHELANDLQTLVLKVDRLERPRPTQDS